MEAYIEYRVGGVRVIPAEEIKEIAREKGVPESTVERDYAQGWLLASLSNHIGMALKGGTGIRKVFIEDYRFSDDLDFTLLEEYSIYDIESRVRGAVISAGKGSGIDFQEEIPVKEVKNGFRASVYFRVLRSSGNPLGVKLDLTGRDKEVILLPLESRRIIHPYSDDVDAEALTYSLVEVIAEKIRALFERTRPRDLYDVWQLSKLGIDVSDIIIDKFRFKDVTLDLDNLHDRKEDFSHAWETSLEHQLKDPPFVDVVFGDVITYFKTIV